MRIVLLLLALAGLATGVLFYLGDDDAVRSVPRSRRGGEAADLERRGFLLFEIRLEHPRGAPAAGATVVYEGPASGRAVADAAGVVQVGGLTEGFYTVRARAGDETGARQFELRAVTHLGTLRLAGTVVVRGRAFDPSGTALAGVVVEAVHASSPRDVAGLARALGEPDTVAARATTNGDGGYSMKVAAGGRYALRAAARPYAAARVPAQRIDAVTAVDFHLARGAAVDGRVFDERGFAVAGARVLVVHPGLPKAEATSSFDGSFHLAVEPTGSPTLVVRAPGFAPYFHRNLRVPAASLRVQLERGIDVTLRVVSARDPDLGLPGVSVVVDLESGFASGTTDGDGRLALPALPTRRDPGTGGDHVILWGEDYAPKVEAVTVAFPARGPLDLGTFTMGRGGTVRGRVSEEGTGRPVAGATVRAWGGLPLAIALAAAPAAVSQADGSYVIEGVPLDATHVFAAHAEYAAPDDLAVLLAGQARGEPLFAPDEETAVRDIVLAPGGAVRGVVEDADGAPAAGATVHVVAADARAAALVGGATDAATTDAGGRFVLSGAPRSVVATHPTLGSSDPVDATPGAEVVITLRSETALKGTVLDPQECPVAGVRVSAGPRVAVTGTQGEYALRPAAGASLVRFDHPGYLVVELRVADVPDRVTLERGPGVRGVVVNANGDPAADVAVTASLQRGAMETGRPWGEAFTDAEGRFAVHGLARGAYTLACRRDGYFAETVTAHTDDEKDARLVLRAAARLKGRVVSGDEPVEGAQVEASTGGVVLSRADGSFVLDALPPGAKVDLTVRHDAFASARRTGVNVGGDAIVIGIDPGIRIGGTVTLPDGTPVQRALVEVTAGTVRARLVTANADGRFLAGGLPAGELKLRVLESGFGLLVAEPVAATAGELAHRVVAVRGEAITGMVYLPDGSPADRVLVTAVGEGGRVAAAAWVDRPGAGYALRGLAPGRYTIRAERVPRREEPGLEGELPAVPAGSRNIEVQMERR